MKKAILFLTLCLPFTGLAQKNQLLVTAQNLTELKNKPIDSTAVYLVISKSVMNDGGGGLYVWIYGATDAEDLVYSNIITSNVSSAGRYFRTTNKNATLPAGTLRNDGGTKTIILNSTTPADGIVTYNLTTDGTASGTAILSADPIHVLAGPRVFAAATPNDIVNGQCTTLAANRKTITCIYGRGSSAVLSLLGVTVVGLRAPITGTPVSLMVIGM